MENRDVSITPATMISELCRICVKSANVDYNIYKTTKQEGGLISLYVMMNELFPTIFNSEQTTTSDQAMVWPTKVCYDCRHSITSAYELYELCLRSTARLKKLLTEECGAMQPTKVELEQVYVPDLVKTEFIESEVPVDQPLESSPRERGKLLRTRRVMSTKEWLNESPKSNAKVRKKNVVPTRRKPRRLPCDEELVDTNGLVNITGSVTNGTKCLANDEHTPPADARENTLTKRKRRTIRQTEESKESGSLEEQDSAENEVSKMEEPHSKIDLYRCQLCDGPTYTSPSELTAHLKTVHPDQIRYCEQCPKVFMSEQAFQHHQYCHATKRSHFCTFCDKGFQTPELLKNHIRMHTHRADYLCSLCGKEFNNRSNLRQHVRRHTGDKPWACNQCPGRFTTKGGLTSHQQTHTRVKAFSCDTCGSQFNKHYSLIKHQLIHTGTRPYSCEVCAMRFTSTYHVKRHMRTHTGEKPFKCTYCERGFAQSNDMVKHMRMHVGDNPYQCDRCDASYRLLAELRNHYKAHYQPSEETPASASTVEDEKGIRFTSTDILKLRYRKEMAQSNVEGCDAATDEQKVLKEETTEILRDS